MLLLPFAAAPPHPTSRHPLLHARLSSPLLPLLLVGRITRNGRQHAHSTEPEEPLRHPHLHAQAAAAVACVMVQEHTAWPLKLPAAQRLARARDPLPP